MGFGVVSFTRAWWPSGPPTPTHCNCVPCIRSLSAGSNTAGLVPDEPSLFNNQSAMKRGDIVKYSKPVDQDEAAYRFVLLAEPEKDRVDVQLICEERIKPIETVSVTEIELATSE